MIFIGPLEFNQVYTTDPSEPLALSDHIGGFDHTGTCNILQQLNQLSNPGRPVLTEYLLPNSVKHLYPNLELRFESKFWQSRNLVNSLYDYKHHPARDIDKFLCSFNGTSHVSRKLLVSALHKFGWFDTDTCSKNFAFSSDVIDGHVLDYTADRSRYYRKFFVDQDSDFYSTVHSFGHHRLSHKFNVQHLEGVLTRSFVNLLSETMATSHQPFVTEKFLYSVITRGLFVGYAQPGWHRYLESYFGFKKFDLIFDYTFDTVTNPVARLIELLSMLGKFSNLSVDDWNDLYLMEKDTIEYNYDHFFSNQYITQLKRSENIDNQLLFV